MQYSGNGKKRQWGKKGEMPKNHWFLVFLFDSGLLIL
jgi:hypothetical protein